MQETARREDFWKNARSGGPGATARTAEEFTVASGENAERLLPGHPEAPGLLRGPRLARFLRWPLLALLRRRLLAGARRGRRRSLLELRVGDLELREGVAHRAELLGVALLDERQDRAGALDGLPHLLEVRLRPLLAGRRREARLAGGEVDQGDERLQQHVVDRDPLHLGLDLAELLFGEVVLRRCAHVTGSSCRYVAWVSRTAVAYTSAGDAPASIMRRWRCAPLSSGSA